MIKKGCTHINLSLFKLCYHNCGRYKHKGFYFFHFEGWPAMFALSYDNHDAGDEIYMSLFFWEIRWSKNPDIIHLNKVNRFYKTHN